MHDRWPLLLNERLSGTQSVDRLFSTPTQGIARDDFVRAWEIVVSLCGSWGRRLPAVDSA